MSTQVMEQGEDNKKVYDFAIKNYGESDEKTRQTLNEVEKIYDDEDHQRGDDFEIKISHGGFELDILIQSIL